MSWTCPCPSWTPATTRWTCDSLDLDSLDLDSLDVDSLDFDSFDVDSLDVESFDVDGVSSFFRSVADLPRLSVL